MKTDKKSTEEQTMAMLLATKQFCRKSKQKDSHCKSGLKLFTMIEKIILNKVI